MATLLALSFLGASSLAALLWLAVLVHPARAWRLRPVAEDEPRPGEPTTWPGVRVIIPAHNEASVVAEALPTVLGQDYPGDWGVVFVDERSNDATAALAAQHARADPGRAGFALVRGESLPAGWTGKVWGLEQGYRRARLDGPDYFLLTDADIAHEAASLRTLVAESESAGLAVNSRMARLHCESIAERLLIPAFVFFFNLLYPMPRVNDPQDGLAACAGGCVLVRATALDSIGGFERIKGEVIDDINLARAVANTSPRLRLTLSRRNVRSLRRYATIGPIWRMIRRTAFDELGYSWLKLAGTVAGILILFVLPPATLLLAAALGGAKAFDASTLPAWPLLAMGFVAVAAIVLMRIAYAPSVAFFDLNRGWGWTLGLAGMLYGIVTVDSAWQYLRGRGRAW